jgi:hypothetical protein
MEHQPKTTTCTTGEIGVSGLSNSRAKQSDPGLAWMMFHSICKIFCEGKECVDRYYVTLLHAFSEDAFEDHLEPKILWLKAASPGIMPEMLTLSAIAQVQQ